MADRSSIIRAATLKSVRERNRLNEQAQRELQALYQRVAEQLAAQAANMVDVSGRVALDQLQWLLTQTQNQISKMGEQRNGMLYRYLGLSADIAAQPFSGQLKTELLFSIKHQSVAFVKSLTGNDGLQLSERLWRLDQGAAQAVSEQIQSAIIRGDSAHQAAAAALSRGQTAPDGTQAALDAASGRQIGRSIRDVMTGAPDPFTGRGEVWQAERVFRTEINRAHGEAYMSAAFETDGVAGIRFNLSPRHPRVDVCDEHASADLYGLGPGVYPERASCPWPAHPNTFSYVTAVFDDELPGAQTAVEKSPPPAPEEPTEPQTLDQYIERGRQHGERLRLGLDNSSFLERLHTDLAGKRGAGSAVASVSNGGVGAKLVQAASRMYPQSWVKQTDALGPLFARKTSGRGWQCTLTEDRATVIINQFGLIQNARRGMGWITAGNFRTAVHEYAHRLQSAMPGLDDIFQGLHQRRTAGMPLKKLRDLTGISYKSGEVTREDHYTNPYQGKVYSPHGRSYVGQYGALEVMTMAFDSVLGGDLSRLTAMLETDREMIDLVLGVLYHYDP